MVLLCSIGAKSNVGAVYIISSNKQMIWHSVTYQFIQEKSSIQQNALFQPSTYYIHTRCRLNISLKLRHLMALLQFIFHAMDVSGTLLYISTPLCSF